MIKLGKDNNRKQTFMTEAQVAQVAAAGTLKTFKGKLNNQQYAKLRKAVAKHDWLSYGFKWKCIRWDYQLIYIESDYTGDNIWALETKASSKNWQVM